MPHGRARALSCLLAAAAVSAGCGRVGYQRIVVGDGSTQDGAIEGGTDAGPDGGIVLRCPWSSGPPAFGAVEHLANVNSVWGELDTTLSPDGRTLYFISTQNDDFEDVYFSTRANVDADFSLPMPQSDANAAGVADTRFFVGPSGLEAFVTSSRAGTIGQSDIFRGTRMTTADAFSGFTSIPLVNSTGEEFDAFLSADSASLYFAPLGRAESMGGQDVYIAVRQPPNGAFAAGTPVPNVNSAADDNDPSLTGDGRVLVFASFRGGGSPRVHYATRADASGSFGAAMVLPALSGEGPITDPFISPDGCELYFTAEGRPDSLGDRDLYRIRATPP